MDKYIFIYTILFSLGITPILGQYQSTTVKTPKGVTVDALRFIGEDFDEDEIEYWNFWWTYAYNCRILANSTNYYNCHGYAWHNIEGHMSQSELRWINDVDDGGNPIYNVTKYYSGSNPSYIEGTNVNHRKVSYFPSDHSALTTEDQDSLISKWAWGPLVKHTPQQCPFYSGSQIKYYKLNPEINGSTSILCSGIQRTFTHDITHMPDATQEWPRSSNLTLIGQDNTSCTITPVSQAHGNAWIKFQITTPSGEVATSNTKSFWAGKPDVPQILGPDELDRFDFAWYFLDSESKSWGDFDWSTSSHFSIKSSTNGDKLKVQAIQPGYGWIYCDVSNVCGTTQGQKLVEISGFRGLMINPNPADTYLDIDIYEEEMNVSELNLEDNYVLRMFDKTGIIRYTDQFKEFPYRINTSNLPEGLYVIQIIYGGQTFSIQVVIEH